MAIQPELAAEQMPLEAASARSLPATSSSDKRDEDLATLYHGPTHLDDGGVRAAAALESPANKIAASDRPRSGSRSTTAGRSGARNTR